ncbi:TRAP transporter substrate-binding protein [Metabacillus litoralis]|uniref:TRAP transporter substrate-binding protein n=1 Tax=Metabacillus litoralis TaxID=152268 RepID=UPI00203FFECF|nr:TRAP transporter substrate-binding protein [Metabacillus litoralis]MCM3411860.1 TRAP transporter substrate-binding protein [Metabacillus litoralis]
MKKTRLFMSMLLIFTISVLAACGNQTSSDEGDAGAEQEGQSYTFKLGHEAQETHIKHMVAEKFKEELESKSDGRMTVDLFPATQLGNEKDMVQQLETGSLDFALISNGYMSSRSESLNGWFMPFLFENLEEGAEARKGEAAKEMLTELESQNLIGFDVFFAGGRHILMKSDSVESVDDLEGKKIRIPGSPVFEAYWSKTGAGPTPMPLPEVYTSLQTGVIDGVDVDLDALLSQKYYEIGKNLTLSNHMIFPEVALGSKAVFDKLSEEDQQIVREAMDAAVEWGVQEGVKLENSRVDEIKEQGVNVTTLSDADKLEPIITEIYNEYSEKSPVIKSFIEENQ